MHPFQLIAKNHIGLQFADEAIHQDSKLRIGTQAIRPHLQQPSTSHLYPRPQVAEDRIVCKRAVRVAHRLNPAPVSVQQRVVAGS